MTGNVDSESTGLFGSKMQANKVFISLWWNTDAKP